MRTKLLSFLLISSFVVSSLPAFAQEAPVELPVEEAVQEAPIEEVVETEEAPLPVEALPEIPMVVETASSIEGTVEPLDAAPRVVVEDAVATSTATSTEDSSISLLIRHGENIAWSGTTTLPTSGTIMATPTGGAGIEIAADSLLAVLLSLDAESDAFAITDLDYYPSFDSFIVNCISADVFAEACSQWQYVVDGQYPFTGIDKYQLEHGDEVFLYFGNPRRVVLSDSNITVGEAFVATAQSYDPETNAYAPLAGYTVGITQPDPSNPWSPREIATSTSAADGTTTFTLDTVGAYDAGLKEDFYFPTTPFTVGSTSDNGSGGGTPTPDTGFDVSAAYDFLRSGQEADGAWDSELVTDWSAIALAISGAPSDMKSALADYLRNEEVNLDRSHVRDYLRHAMALMALNINPYTGGQEDYIEPIVESFDGTQIDEPGIVNDDAFALIVLLNAGYTKDDEIIQKITEFIVTEQHSDGSWDGGVDVSGPYIQALAKVRSLPGVSGALSRAESYLRAQQESDGGFGDPFATAWAIQGIEALGGAPETWTKGEHTPLTYLANSQQEDGGLTTNPDTYMTRAWATAYAIPAVKGITWDSVLKNFRKPAASEDDSRDEEGNADNDTNATTTDDVIILPAPFALETAATTSATVPPQPSTDVVVLGLSAEPTSVRTSDAVTEEPAPEPEPNPLTASAIESGAWSWVKNFFSSLWAALVGLFR